MAFDENRQRGFGNALSDTHLICSMFQQGLDDAICGLRRYWAHPLTVGFLHTHISTHIASGY